MPLAKYAKRKQEPEPIKPAPKIERKTQPATETRFNPIDKDPRPDLTQDSYYWGCLLAEAALGRDKRAHLYKSGIYDLLYAMRKAGTRLEGNKLVPVIGEGGWKTEDDFRKVATECLAPRNDQVKALMQQAARLKNTLQRLS